MVNKGDWHDHTGNELKTLKLQKKHLTNAVPDVRLLPRIPSTKNTALENLLSTKKIALNWRKLMSTKKIA